MLRTSLEITMFISFIYVFYKHIRLSVMYREYRRLKQEHAPILELAHLANEREEQLNILERDLNTQENNLTSNKLALNSRASTIAQKEKDLNLRSTFLDTQTKELSAKYGPLEDIAMTLAEKKKEYKKLDTEYQTLTQQLENLTHYNDVEYGYVNNYIEYNDMVFKQKIEDVQNKQKILIKEGNALTTHTREYDHKYIQSLFKTIEKLAIKVFNAESTLLVNSLNVKNIDTIESKLTKVKERINKSINTIGIDITNTFYMYKLEELLIEYAHQSLIQRNKENEQDQKRLLREAYQLQKQEDLEDANEELQLKIEIENSKKEELKYEELLAQAKIDITNAKGAELKVLELEILKLNDALVAAQAKSQRAISMAQQTKKGHVYVISNVGSFGENIYKIGVTRRVDPYIRVNELGSASVPFTFDVHAMILSEDAPALESKLHKAFEKYRVNKVNLRKEFFNVDINKICEVLKKDGYEILLKDPVALEYKKSLCLEA